MDAPTAVIPVAGLGTRMIPATIAVPKEALPLPRIFKGVPALYPMIYLVIERLYEAGVKNYVVVLSREKEVIKDMLTPDYTLLERVLNERKELQAEILRNIYRVLEDIEVTYVYQEKPEGFGAAVKLASKYVDGDFIVHTGDDYIACEENYINLLLQTRAKLNADIVTFVERVENPHHYGVIKAEEAGKGIYRVTDIVEKPEDPPSNMAVIAIYYMSREIWRYIEQVSMEPGWELTDAVKTALEEGLSMYAIEVLKEDRIDVGRPETYIDGFLRLVRRIG